MSCVFCLPAESEGSSSQQLEFAPSFPIERGHQAPRVLVTLDPGAEPWHHDSEAETLSWSHPGVCALVCARVCSEILATTEVQGVWLVPAPEKRRSFN